MQEMRTIYGVICPDCKGKRYKIISRIEGTQLKNIKKACETCDGAGVIKAPNDKRNGITRERE